MEGDFLLEGFLFSSFLVELSLSLVLKVERSSSSYSGPNVSVTIWSSSGGGGNGGGGGGGGAGLNMKLFLKENWITHSTPISCILFHQITTFVKVCVAFVFGLQPPDPLIERFY